MLYKLSSSNIDTLKKMPESGMGYQLVKTNKTSYVSEILLVLNGKLAIRDDALKFTNVLNVIIGKDLNKAMDAAKEIHIPVLDIVSPRKSFGIWLEEDTNDLKKINAINGKTENANGDELFVRLSAFEDDIRVDKVNNCLLPGSYTTTASDALRCKIENDNPVNRYALPNELEINWAFFIQAKTNDTLQRGFVQPNFGKAGGGKEVYFEKGTSKHTFITQTKW